MADLTTVKEDLTDVGWLNNNAVLVRDEATGEHYAVSTLSEPWMAEPETLAFPTDAEGSVAGTAEQFVAGGPGMDRDAALADLNARLDEGRLLTMAEAEEIAQAATEADFEAFLKFVLSGSDEAEAVLANAVGGEVAQGS